MSESRLSLYRSENGGELKSAIGVIFSGRVNNIAVVSDESSPTREEEQERHERSKIKTLSFMLLMKYRDFSAKSKSIISLFQQ